MRCAAYKHEVSSLQTSGVQPQRAPHPYKYHSILISLQQIGSWTLKVQFSFQMSHLKKDLWWPFEFPFRLPFILSHLNGLYSPHAFCFFFPGTVPKNSEDMRGQGTPEGNWNGNENAHHRSLFKWLIWKEIWTLSVQVSNLYSLYWLHQSQQCWGWCCVS